MKWTEDERILENFCLFFNPISELSEVKFQSFSKLREEKVSLNFISQFLSLRDLEIEFIWVFCPNVCITYFWNQTKLKFKKLDKSSHKMYILLWCIWKRKNKFPHETQLKPKLISALS